MPATKGRRKHRRRALPKQPPVPAAVPLPVPREQEVQAKEAAGVSRLLFRQRVAPAILLALATFTIYYQVIHLPFSNYDDADYVSENTVLWRGVTWPLVRWALTSTEHANWHPVTWISHALDWQMFGADPSGHHLTNLLLHVLNVVLLFLFLSLVTKSTARSLLVAALFALHPLGVETVAWVSERKNLLCATLFLITLLAYALYAQRPNVSRYLLTTLLCAFSLAAKPMVVTLPFLLLLLDYWPLQRIKGWTQPSAVFPAPQLPPWKLVLEKLPLLALSVADSKITLVAQQKALAIHSMAEYPLSLRVENAIVSYAEYVSKVIWPARLAVLYPYPTGGFRLATVLFCALVLIGISAWVWRERSRPYLLTGWLWFMGMFVPVIGIIQVGEQSMADRYAYLPLIGFLILVVWRLFDLAEEADSRIRWSMAAAAVIVLVAFAALSVRQIGYWKSNISLWSHAVKVTNNNAAAEDVVGSEILDEALNNGLHSSKEAQVHFQNALRINPKDGEALLNIAGDLQVHGHTKEALEKYKLALQYVQYSQMEARVLTGMGLAYEQSGDWVAARDYYQQALKISPKANNAAFTGFARTFTDEKIGALKPKLAQHPTAEGYWELGQLQDEGGYTDLAIAAYRRTLELDPKLEKARAALDRDSTSQGPARGTEIVP
jgi:protein O-mannosyl-transferase